MVWAPLPPERLQFLTLFDYEIIGETGQFMVARHGSGKLVTIDKKKPSVWFEDVGEAIQAGAKGAWSVTTKKS